MRLLKQDGDQLDINLGMDDLIVLANCLRQLHEDATLTETEFLTAIGVSRSEAELLLLRIDEVLEQLGVAFEAYEEEAE